MTVCSSGYDGGDCCRCTCISFDGSPCGTGNEFECRDPTAPCIDDDDANTSGYTSTFKCLTEFFGDGDCDLENNEEDCGTSRSVCALSVALLQVHAIFRAFIPFRLRPYSVLTAYTDMTLHRRFDKTKNR